MAYTKTVWENGTTPVNSTNMNKIEQGIYDNSRDIYSTTEALTNKVWVDSNSNEKPVYRKTFYISSLPNKTSVEIPINVSNVELYTDLRGFVNSDLAGIHTGMYPMNVKYSGGGDGVELSIGNGNLEISCTSNMSSVSGYVVVEYTKTVS